MRWIALAGGLLGAALNYALLAAGCRRILAGTKRGALLILGGVLVPAIGLALSAAFSPAVLPWTGCACAGALILLAAARMLHFIRKKM
ncbi:MAG: hypothetical protein LBB75_02205 [Oscillospiraceae bacterium]|nr:hypothetical protein [Oscillospiraceae bacterium]